MSMTETNDLQERWDWAWRTFDEALEDLGDNSGQRWDPWALAMFLDVPSFLIAELIPSVRAAGLANGFDFYAKIRTSVAAALRRIRKKRPLHLEFGLTEAILTWEWMDMMTAGEPAWAFFDRLRSLRLRLPEVALDERATHRFCTRVPAPRITD